jgi:hypothetical protein
MSRMPTTTGRRRVTAQTTSSIPDYLNVVISDSEAESNTESVTEPDVNSDDENNWDAPKGDPIDLIQNQQGLPNYDALLIEGLKGYGIYVPENEERGRLP